MHKNGWTRAAALAAACLVGCARGPVDGEGAPGADPPWGPEATEPDLLPQPQEPYVPTVPVVGDEPDGAPAAP